MSTKLYNQKDLVVKEISVAEFDAIEGNHVFSDEYEKKKQNILDAFQEQNKKHSKKNFWKTVVATLALFMVSGTAVALSGNYLELIYNAKDVNVKEKYIYDAFVNAEYNLPAEITTSVRKYAEIQNEEITDEVENLMDFQVLQAAKGEHTISYAILVTVNDPEMKSADNWHWWMSSINIPGYEEIERTLGCGWDSLQSGYGKEIGLASNQRIEVVEYQFDESVDISKINTIEINYSLITEVLESDYQENYYGEVDTREVDCSHVWTVKFDLKDEYMDYSFELGQEYELFDAVLNIERIDLSPIGMNFVYETVKENKFDESTPRAIEYFANYGENIKLQMSDGGKISMKNLCEGGATFCGEEEERFKNERYDFEIPIDVEQVTAIEVDGQIIELKK